MRNPTSAGRCPMRLIMALCTAALLGCESVFLGPPQYASVSVLVTDSLGTGIPALWLQLYTGERILAYGETDSSGRYLFTNVPPGGYGVLLPTPAGYEDPGGLPYLFIDNLTVTAGSVEPVRFKLTACRGVIDATVTETSGASAQGVNLLFYTSSAAVERLKTYANGTRSLDVKCGQYGVRVDPTPGYISPAGRGSSYVDGLVVHRNAHVAATLRVQSCFGALRVTVTDSTNAPLSQARLVAYTSTVNLASAYTGSDGRYTFARIPCGSDLGVTVADAPAGYRVVEGRGNRFVDGVLIENNTVTDVTFRLATP